MVEINRYGWHGRLTRYVFGDSHIQNTPSICPYFWSVVVSLFMAPIQYTVEALDYWGYTLRITLIFVFIFAILGSIYRPDLTLILGGSAVLLFNVIVGVIAFTDWYEKKYPYVAKSIPTPPPQREKQKSLLWEWLKARKDKVCPPIYEVKTNG